MDLNSLQSVCRDKAKKAKDFFEELRYCYLAVQRHQSDLESLNTNREEHIIGQFNKNLLL